MPEKDGIELITDLRITMPNLLILAISSGGLLDANRNLDRALECGANQTLPKPFSKNQIIDFVNTLLTPTNTTSL